MDAYTLLINNFGVQLTNLHNRFYFMTYMYICIETAVHVMHTAYDVYVYNVCMDTCMCLYVIAI